MAPLSFLAGIVCTLAVLILLLPWLRTIPRFDALPALPWPAGMAALLALAAMAAALTWTGRAPPAAQSRPTPAPLSAGSSLAAAEAATSLAGVAEALGEKPRGDRPAAALQASAGSMDSAIAALQARLAKGGGSDGDWELLAKSYEFIGRPDDAKRARAHSLPPLPSGAAAAPSAESVAINGTVALAAALRGKVSAGETIFIVAKSVDSPGPPVAVFRGSVGRWPLAFTLDESQSMIPGRTLSTAGRVSVEARISPSGQPLPSAGDLQGASAAFDPKQRRPLEILIDRVVP